MQVSLRAEEVHRPAIRASAFHGLRCRLWVGTASPGDGGAVGGALPSGSPEAYDRTTSYSSRSDQHGLNGPMTA